MRPIRCHKCLRVFRGGGATRVMNMLVFTFCPSCWRDREACERFMQFLSNRAGDDAFPGAHAAAAPVAALPALSTEEG